MPQLDLVEVVSSRRRPRQRPTLSLATLCTSFIRQYYSNFNHSQSSTRIVSSPHYIHCPLALSVPRPSPQTSFSPRYSQGLSPPPNRHTEFPFWESPFDPAGSVASRSSIFPWSCSRASLQPSVIAAWFAHFFCVYQRFCGLRSRSRSQATAQDSSPSHDFQRQRRGDRRS
jgi:hypothetical protein